MFGIDTLMNWKPIAVLRESNLYSPAYNLQTESVILIIIHRYLAIGCKNAA